MTREQLAALPHGATLHHKTLKNSDGSPLRARVNGVLRTWKRDPSRFQLPMKHGLKQCFYITAENANEWRPADDTNERLIK